MTKPASTIHQTRRDRRVPVDRRRLPAAPLLELVHSAARRRQQPLEELLGTVDGRPNPWLLAALRQAEISGAVTVLTGEHVCDVLGWHPRMVWGDTYDATIHATTPVPRPTHQHRQEVDTMANDNFTVQIGNLTDDPELRFTQNGTPVTNFGLAVNQRIREADGSWRDGETSFFRVNVWRDQAENTRSEEHTSELQ